MRIISLLEKRAFYIYMIGEDELWPDWSSLRVCTYKTGHASVMCKQSPPARDAR